MKQFIGFLTNNGRDAPLRAIVSGDMHRRPTGLLIASGCGIVAGSYAAANAHNAPLQWLSLALIVIGLFRMAAAWRGRQEGPAGALARRAFKPGALAFAAALGLTAGCALFEPTDNYLAMMLVGYAIAHGAALALGNAPRPRVALAQTALVFVPLTLAAVLSGATPLLLFGAIMAAIALGNAVTMLDLFRAVGNQVAAARDEEARARELRREAMTDALTGLSNRAGLELQAREIFEIECAPPVKLLVWTELHNFRTINETLGHRAGDKVLQEVAARMTLCAPAEATVARYGCDDFLLLAACESLRDAEAIAERLCEELALPVRVEGNRIDGCAALGAAIMIGADCRLEDLMDRADLALYHAKRAGRGQLRFWDQAMSRNVAQRKEIESDLRAAIQKDELSIYFQPIIDLSTGRIRSFEALLRWFHPDRGELPPSEFIPVAEETGLIITLGNWIIRRAASTCASWPEQVGLCVNLSPVQMRAPGAALGILAALRDAGLDPRRLELEVTESLFLEDSANTKRFFDDLGREGVAFSLDDFGTGNSSLQYINRYPFRTIKVDRSFVSGPQVGKRNAAVVRAVAEMGITLGIEIVAEGLETQEQVQAVREAGCTLGQGYYFSRAVPDHLAALLLIEEAQRASVPRMAG